MSSTTPFWTEAKRAAHWRESGATQRVPIFAEANFATDVGESIVEMLDFRRCDAFGRRRREGKWVVDETVHCILRQLEQLDAATLCIFRPFEALVCEAEGTPLAPIAAAVHTAEAGRGGKRDIVIVVNDRSNKHYFAILVETFPRQKSIHVFDSLLPRKTDDIKRLLRRFFTPSFSFDGYNFHNYTRHNFTRKPLQSGATCGPWAVWIAVAFIFDINNCRRRRSKHHGRMRVASLKMANDDVVGFWRHLVVGG